MKLFILYGTICAVLLVNVKANWDAVDEGCVNELHLNKTAIEIFEAQEFVPENNVNYNTFLECVGRQQGIFTNHGDIDWEKLNYFLVQEFQQEFGNDPDIRKYISALKVMDVVNGCKPRATGSKGQKIAKLQNCVVITVKRMVEAKHK